MASLLAPMLIDRKTFFVDWANHLYLLDRQRESIAATGQPTFFLHTETTGLFAPVFLFYGGTLYAIGGYLAVVLQSSWGAYVLLFAVGFAMAYGGTYWVGRTLRLGVMLAHAPAVVVVTSAYYLTNAYGRGAWPEFVAVSAIPLVIAAAIDLLVAPAARPRTAFLLAAGIVFVSGSHNITLLFGALFVVLLVVTVVSAFGVAWMRQWRGRIGLTLGIALCALAVNAWFLLPDIVWARTTVIANVAGDFIDQRFSAFFDRASVVLFPGRFVPQESTTPELYVQAPVFVLLWVLAAIVLLHQERRLRRLSWGLLGVLGLVLIFTIVDRAWDYVPRVLKNVQFPFRLQTYVVLSTAALMLVLLPATRRARSRVGRRAWLATLTLAVGASLGLGEYQAWSAEQYLPVSQVTGHPSVLPATFYGVGGYRVAGGDRTPRPREVIRIDPREVVNDRAVIEGGAPGRYATNIVYSGAVAMKGGADLVGPDEDGFAVIEGHGDKSWHAVVETSRAEPIVAGRILSIAGLTALLVLIGAVAVRSRRSA